MFKGVVLSDFHLAASKLHHEHQHNTLKLFLYPYLKEDINVFIISGDFFDTSLLFDHDASITATMIMTEICNLCKSNNIKLRLLRGTFSHDREQLKQFATIANHYQIDYKYFDTISVDKIDNFTFIYFPDTLPYKSIDEVVKIGYTLLQDTYQVSIPDIVIGHGYFKHRIPSEKLLDLIPHYTTEMFKDVKLVFFGHEHLHWNKDNVYSIGSFDRLNHGEESPKGFMIFSIDNDSIFTKFIENKLAIQHITIETNGESIDEKLLNLSKSIEVKFNKNYTGYLRIKDNTDDRLVLVSLLKDKYPDLHITSINDISKVSDKKLSLDFTTYHYDIPTLDTLESDLLNFLKDVTNVSIDKNLFNKYLTEVKQNAL